METIRVWIPINDVNLIQENKRPTSFWLEKPDLTNVTDVTISLTRYQEWNKSSNKQVLFG